MLLPPKVQEASRVQIPLGQRTAFVQLVHGGARLHPLSHRESAIVPQERHQEEEHRAGRRTNRQTRRWTLKLPRCFLVVIDCNLIRMH